MAYATITADNVGYQPRLNIIQLIQNSLTDKSIQVYTSFPDITSRDFMGFPIIVVPDVNEELPTEYLKGNIQFNTSLAGEIYHDYDKLGDDKVRMIKANLKKAFFKRSNSETLQKLRQGQLSLQFNSSDNLPEIRSGKSLVSFTFDVMYNIDVYMDA